MASPLTFSHEPIPRRMACIFCGNGAICLRSNVQKQAIRFCSQCRPGRRSDPRSRAELVVLGVAPGIQSCRCIRLPDIRLDVSKLSSFYIRHCQSKRKGIVLVVDSDFDPPSFAALVVVVGSQIFQIRLYGADAESTSQSTIIRWTDTCQ